VVVVFANTLVFLALVDRWPVMLREIRSGMYHPAAYTVVTSSLVGPVNFCAVLLLLPMPYLIVDLPLSTFFELWAAFGMVATWFESWAELASFLGREPGLVLVAQAVVATAYSCGVFLDWTTIIWPLHSFSYVLPGRLFLSTIVSVVFRESDDFSGAVEATNATVMGVEALAAGFDFYCPDAAVSTVCYGRTGPEVLSQLHAKYAIAEPDTDYGRNVGWIALMIVALRLMVIGGSIAASLPAKGRMPLAERAATERSTLLP